MRRLSGELSGRIRQTGAKRCQENCSQSFKRESTRTDQSSGRRPIEKTTRIRSIGWRLIRHLLQTDQHTTQIGLSGLRRRESREGSANVDTLWRLRCHQDGVINDITAPPPCRDHPPCCARKMKIFPLIFLIFLTASVHGTPEVERIESVISNYVENSGKDDPATIFINEKLDAEFYWMYWAETRMLFSIPREFSDEAIDAPSSIMRKPLVYPDDVREKGNKEMESSTYLVSFEWYQQKLTKVVTGGNILHLTKHKHNQSGDDNSE